jgi:hypothetical protein
MVAMNRVRHRDHGVAGLHAGRGQGEAQRIGAAADADASKRYGTGAA